MQLYANSIAASAWVATVTRAFFGVRPWTSLALVLSITASRISALLAFFLPLKVILLAGSEGVPRYFRFFIDPADKFGWIIGLSLAAVGFYILYLVLERVSAALSEAGSSEVLQGANEIAVASRQREEAQGYYVRFCGISANVLLFLLGFLILGLINPLLIAILSGLIVVQYVGTGLVLEHGDALNPGRVHGMIRTNLSGYLTIFSSVDFLVGFFVILIPFVVGTGGNLLFAILSILLMRQALGALSGGIGSTTELWQKKAEVDPMVFRDRQLQAREKPVTRDLRHVFAKASREAVAAEELAGVGIQADGLESRWRDSKIKGVFTFELQVPESAGEPRRFQQQVFARSHVHLLEHEAFLFEQVQRPVLHAPPARARYRDGPFECQICEFGTGKGPVRREWRAVSRRLLADLWSFAPPKHLEHAFNTSRPTLAGRLVPDYLERLEVAADTPAERRTYEAFLETLPHIQAVLRAMPVYIDNPDLLPENVTALGEDDYRIMTWGRWTLEPVGATLLRSMEISVADAFLEPVRNARELPPEALTPDNVRLARECRELEREIAKGLYNKALQRMRRILGIELVAGDSAVVGAVG